MPRYVAGPARSEWWEAAAVPLPTPTVYVGDPVQTGLLDAEGRDIYRLLDQIGFVRHHET